MYIRKAKFKKHRPLIALLGFFILLSCKKEKEERWFDPNSGIIENKLLKYTSANAEFECIFFLKDFKRKLTTQDFTLFIQGGSGYTFTMDKPEPYFRHQNEAVSVLFLQNQAWADYTTPNSRGVFTRALFGNLGPDSDFNYGIFALKNPFVESGFKIYSPIQISQKGFFDQESASLDEWKTINGESNIYSALGKGLDYFEKTNSKNPKHLFLQSPVLAHEPSEANYIIYRAKQLNVQINCVAHYSTVSNNERYQLPRMVAETGGFLFNSEIQEESKSGGIYCAEILRGNFDGWKTKIKINSTSGLKPGMSFVGYLQLNFQKGWDSRLPVYFNIL